MVRWNTKIAYHAFIEKPARGGAAAYGSAVVDGGGGG